MREDLRQRYSELEPALHRLGAGLRDALADLLAQNAIRVLDVSHRIKTFESFCEKVTRKHYSDPFRQTVDLCGVRIIVFSPGDMQRVDELLRSEFMIDEALDRSSVLREEEFGYRSNHYVVRLRSTWLSVPGYRGLGDLLAEVQVRTVLMHAWADLSHRLSYKSAEQTPAQFRRRIFRLSALFELADDEFEKLHEEKRQLQQRLTSVALEDPRHFAMTHTLNLDTLQVYLNLRFIGRELSTDATLTLVDEMIESGVSLLDLENGCRRLDKVLTTHEEQFFGTQIGRRWSQIGIARHVLDVTSDGYWAWRCRSHIPKPMRDAIETQRRALAEREATA
jgi:putative GTP pyrophosphokinase